MVFEAKIGKQSRNDLSPATMMTSSNGNIFRVTGHLCREFTGPDEFPTQRPVMRSFHVYFDLRPNKRLSKQSWGWWFETLWRPLWRHHNDWEANMDGLVQDCSNSIANALELLQSYTKPSIYSNSQEAHGNVFTLLCFALVWLRLSSVKCNHICKGYITGTEKNHTRFA